MAIESQRKRPSRWKRLINVMKSVGRPQVATTISADKNGFKVESVFASGSVSTHRATWKSITKVVAYKRDCVTVDLLCLAIEVGDQTLEVHEEMAGWNSLINSLPDWLPGCQPQNEWWEAVVHPAFATNERTIFPR